MLFCKSDSFAFQVFLNPNGVFFIVIFFLVLYFYRKTPIDIRDMILGYLHPHSIFSSKIE